MLRPVGKKAGTGDNRICRTRMGIACLLVALAVLGHASYALAAPSESVPAIMVLNIKHEEEAGPGIAKILTELVLQDLHDLKKFRVIGEKDVDQLLTTEQRKQLAGCTDTSCIVEIAGAMGTQYTLDGTVGVVGQSNVLSVSLLDVTKAVVVSRKTTVVKGEREQLLESVHKLIIDLMEPVTKETATRGAPKVLLGPAATIPAGTVVPAKAGTQKTVEPSPGPPMNPYRLWGHVGVWGGLTVVALGGGFTALAKKAADDYNTGKDIAGAKSNINNYDAAAVTCYVLGAGMVATGVVLWVLDPGDEKWAKEHRVSFVPTLDDGRVGFAVSGGW